MKKEFIFVKSLKGKSEKGFEYDFVVVSNGILAGNVGNPAHIDFSTFKEGDKLNIEVDVKPNGKSWEVNAVALVPVEKK